MMTVFDQEQFAWTPEIVIVILSLSLPSYYEAARPTCHMLVTVMSLFTFVTATDPFPCHFELRGYTLARAPLFE